MKKSLRGKRYIRSRSTVAIGRINKKIRKTARVARYLKNIDVQQLSYNIAEAFTRIIEQFNSIDWNAVFTPLIEAARKYSELVNTNNEVRE